MLRPLVETACKALKDEDQFLRAQISQNPLAYPGQRAGILRPGFVDEKYYQRLLARQLLTLPHEVLLEVPLAANRHDLVLTQPQQKATNWFAVIEIKCWTGNLSLAGIAANVRTLQQLTGAALPQITSTTHRIMLIFSENPNGQTSGNCQFLDNTLRALLNHPPLTAGQNFELDSFLTYSDYPAVSGMDMDFWVAGIEVA